MSPYADLVQEISATGFQEAIYLMGCLAVLREGNSLVIPRVLKSANAALAARMRSAGFMLSGESRKSKARG